MPATKTAIAAEFATVISPIATTITGLVFYKVEIFETFSAAFSAVSSCFSAIF